MSLIFGFSLFLNRVIELLFTISVMHFVDSPAISSNILYILSFTPSAWLTITGFIIHFVLAAPVSSYSTYPNLIIGYPSLLVSHISSLPSTTFIVVLTFASNDFVPEELLLVCSDIVDAKAIFIFLFWFTISFKSHRKWSFKSTA